ncbi:S8 family serine peptidase [Bradyrhizobium liaoningense]
MSLPAAAVGVVSVGAIGKGAAGYEMAPFSNSNPKLCAPGVGIVSAKCGGGLVAMDGTSMAAPHVTGAAVLWSERLAQDNSGFDVEFLRANLLTACSLTGFAPFVKATDRGRGLVHAPAAQ